MKKELKPVWLQANNQEHLEAIKYRLAQIGYKRGESTQFIYKNFPVPQNRKG